MKPEYVKNTPLENIQYRNPYNYMALEDVYLGPLVESSLSQLQNVPKTEITTFRQKCLAFYVVAANQIYKRFPMQANTAKILKEIAILDPVNVKMLKRKSLNLLRC